MFDLWRAQRAKSKLDKFYRQKADDLRKAGEMQKREELMAEWANEGDMAEDRIDGVLSDRLVKSAQRLDVPTPPFPIAGQEREREFWSRNYSNGSYQLTREGRVFLRDAVRKEKRERFDSKVRWIAPLTGIIGAAIGLISVLGTLMTRLHK
jgi:hypothetical protein